MEKGKQCVWCGEFLSENKKRRNAKFCSNNCYERQIKQDREQRNDIVKKMPTQTRGIISELKAITYLLENGYEVFHAVSSSCSCDIAVLKNRKLYRVEIRTGYYMTKDLSRVAFPVPNNKEKYEYICVVAKNKITFHKIVNGNVVECDFFKDTEQG